MKIRTDAAFQAILDDARKQPVITVARQGSAKAHYSVTHFNEVIADFGVDHIAQFHRGLSALWQRSYHNGWIPHERPVINDMQTDTNLFFSSGAGPDAIRALQHMKRIQHMVAKMKA